MSKISMISGGFVVVLTSVSIASVMSSKTRILGALFGSANSELSGVAFGNGSTASLDCALFLCVVFGELNLLSDRDTLAGSFSGLSDFRKTPSRDVSLSTMPILSSPWLPKGSVCPSVLTFSSCFLVGEVDLTLS